MFKKHPPTPEELKAKLLDDFMDAAAAGRTAEVSRYLDQGVGVNSLSISGKTALFYAVEKGHADTVRLLLDRHALVNVTVSPALAAFGETPGQTPLLLAAQYNYRDIAEMLIDRGADVKAADGYRMTALHYAARRGNFTLALYLLDRGADPVAQDKWHRTPAALARQGGHRNLSDYIQKRAGLPPLPKYEP